MDPEDVQLYYQIAVTGRRDLGLAPSYRSGCEMTILRMFAFEPADPGTDSPPVPPARPAATSGEVREAGPAPEASSAPESAAQDMPVSSAGTRRRC